MAETTEIVENEFNVDVAVRTIRGRACPICSGKIIPSNRAVYQSSGDPSEVFALWECERCGFSERFERPEEPKKLHGEVTKAIAGSEKVAVKASPASSSSVSGIQPATKATRRAAKRANPIDVENMLEVMKRTEPKIQY